MLENNLNELINDFIAQRTNHICIRVYKKKEYNNLRKKYIKVRDILEKELPTNKRELIEKLEECAISYYTLNDDEEYVRNKDIEEFSKEILSILKGENQVTVK